MKVRQGLKWQTIHPRPWERLVQSKFRTASPPYPAPEFCELGWDKDGIGAAVFWEELDGPGQVELHVAAVANRYRGRGGGVADEMMTHAFDTMTVRAIEVGVDFIEASTWIDESNKASQKMCRRFGLRQVAFKEDENLQRWSVVLQVSGADLPD